MAPHGHGCRITVMGYERVYNFLVLLKRGPDLPQRPKGMAAVITGARPHTQHLLAQVRVTGGAINQFMKVQVALLPAREVIGVCHYSALFVMLKDGLTLLGLHALARQAYGNPFKFG